MSEGDTSGSEGDQNHDEGNDNWRSGLSVDLQNNPTLQKYNSAEDAHKAHLELQSKLGSDRVAWPKDSSDEAGWGEIDKRRGVPEKSEGYGLDAVNAPKGSGLETFDRMSFQEQMKAINASPAQAQAAWKNYTDMQIASHVASDAAFKEAVEANKAGLMQEWGEAYESNIQRGNAVIENFSATQEEKDYLTATFAKDPGGSKFLAKIGGLMAESSIGGFQEKKNFTLTPEEARIELDQIKANTDYMSDDDRVRIPLVNRSNDLMKMLNPGKPQRQTII